MEKVCRKSELKTIPITLLNFGKYPKTANACKRLLKIRDFKRDHEKLNLIFSFALSNIFRKDHKKRPGTRYQSLFESQNMFRKVPFFVRPFESGNCTKGKKWQNTQYLKNEKAF